MNETRTLGDLPAPDEQTSRRLVALLSTEREVSSPETATRVLDWMRAHADGNGDVSFSAYDLAPELGIARQTIYNATRRLLRDGAVSIRRKGTGHLYPTTWHVA